MKVKDKFQKICSYQGSYFQEWFGGMEFEKSTTPLYSKTLEFSMSDQEILRELKPTEVSLGEIYHQLEKSSHDMWHLFYCKDNAGVLRAVFVYWYDGGWDVYARSIEYPNRWYGGFQVFSRNSFESLPAPMDLESAIALVKKEGYRIFKEI